MAEPRTFYRPIVCNETLKVGGAVTPLTSDGAALGSATKMFSDVFLASGGVVNFNNGDVTVTHSTNTLAFAGASSGYTFDAVVKPSTTDGAALGSGTVMWSDLFLASAAVINFNNGDVTITHSEDKLTIANSSAIDTATTLGTLAVNQTLTGASAVNSSEVLVGSLTTAVQTGNYVNGVVGRLNFSTTGYCSGLAGAVCGEIDMPSTAGYPATGAGNYACFDAEINCPTGYNSTVPLSVLYIAAWGGAVAQFDHYGYLFNLTGVTSDAAHIWYDYDGDPAAHINEWIRVKTPNGAKYLPLYDAIGS